MLTDIVRDSIHVGFDPNEVIYMYLYIYILNFSWFGFSNKAILDCIKANWKTLIIGINMVKINITGTKLEGV